MVKHPKKLTVAPPLSPEARQVAMRAFGTPSWAPSLHESVRECVEEALGVMKRSPGTTVKHALEVSIRIHGPLHVEGELFGIFQEELGEDTMASADPTSLQHLLKTFL